MKISKLAARISGLGLGLTGATVTTLVARAQPGCGVPPLNIPCNNLPGLRTEPIGPVILAVISIGLGVAGSVAVLFLIVGGFLYITAAGDEQRLEKAKTTLKNAIIGTVFILLALVIVLTIQQFIGK